MKRLHVSLAVSDLAKSRHFYAAMFGGEPTLEHEHYVQWVLDDPAVNFVIEDGNAEPGLTHLGIQAQDQDEFEQQVARANETGADSIDQGDAHCCYARSTKNWTVDPDGIPWETFLTHERTSDFGMPFVGTVNEADDKPQMPATAHCGCC